MAALDREVRAWNEKNNANPFDAFVDDRPLPKELEDGEKEIAGYPADIRNAARELNKFFSEVEIEAKSHSLDALRILLNGEHIFYELAGKDLEEAHEAIWEEARRAE